MRKVAVTGLGMLSPLGVGKASTWQALLAGRSGIRRISRFDPSPFPVQIAGEVPGFDPLRFVEPTALRRLDRFLQFSLAASLLALEDAGLQAQDVPPPRAGVYIGSAVGGMETLEDARDTLRDRGPRRVSPFFIPRLLVNLAPGVVAIRTGFQGPCMSHVSACASGTHAIGEAARAIQHGQADLMLAGGAEAAVTPLSLAGFYAMRALSTQNSAPEQACRPFDAQRDGLVVAEGAGILVLEELEAARQRQAHIYCLLEGYGLSADAWHIVAPPPDGRGLARAIDMALQDAACPPAEVDYVNAHGSATRDNDAAETQALKQVFGAHAPRLWINSTKSMTGHLLGAAGGLEAAVTALSLDEGMVHPTLNLEHPDPACDLDYVPGASRSRKLRAALSCSAGFGGQNAALLFRRVSP